MVERVKTGIVGLDELMEGGIPKNHVVLISGQAGAGKTLFGLQFLVHGARNNERGVFLTLEQTREDVFSQTKNFNWELEKLEGEGKIKILAFKSSDMHISKIISEVEQLMQDFKPDRFVLDSLTTLSVYSEIMTSMELLNIMGINIKEATFIPSGEAITRRTITEFLSRIKNFSVTSLAISELPETSIFLSRDTISEFIADGVILLNYVGIVGEANRTLNIRKMRGSDHSKDVIPYDICKGEGIILKPDESSKLLMK
jgi:KaiC/GvpD/RAD55 family RecA-like ATPase